MGTFENIAKPRQTPDNTDEGEENGRASLFRMKKYKYVGNIFSILHKTDLINFLSESIWNKR